jgi:hypothetical protein
MFICIFLFLILILLFLITYFIIKKICNLCDTINKANLNLYILQQKIIINSDKFKRLFKAKKIKKNNFHIYIKVLDFLLTLIYKQKYKRLKTYYEFLKYTIN